MRRVWMLMAVAAMAFGPVASAENAGAEQTPPEKKFGHLGVQPAPLDEALADQLGLDDGRGVLVARVQEGSAAEKARIRPNDVIVKVDDQVIFNADQLSKLISSHKPGRAVVVHLLRKGEAKAVPVVLGGVARRPWTRARPMMPVHPWAPGPWGGPGGVRMERGPDGQWRIITPDGRRLEVPEMPGLEDVPVPDEQELKRFSERLKKRIEEWMRGRGIAPAPPTTQPDEDAAPPARPQRIEHRPDVRLHVVGPGEMKVQVDARAGQEGRAVATFAMTVSGKGYTARLTEQSGQAPHITLKDRQGNLILDDVPADQVRAQLNTYDPDAQALLRQLLQGVSQE